MPGSDWCHQMPHNPGMEACVCADAGVATAAAMAASRRHSRRCRRIPTSPEFARLCSKCVMLSQKLEHVQATAEKSRLQERPRLLPASVSHSGLSNSWVSSRATSGVAGSQAYGANLGLDV